MEPHPLEETLGIVKKVLCVILTNKVGKIFYYGGVIFVNYVTFVLKLLGIPMLVSIFRQSACYFQ
jgi:hypothetical protein